MSAVIEKIRGRSTLIWRSRNQLEPDKCVSDDGLDENVWGKINEVLAAAHRGDRGAFVHASGKLTQALSLEKQRLAGAYIHYPYSSTG
jgi:hypothetical protein